MSHKWVTYVITWTLEIHLRPVSLMIHKWGTYVKTSWDSPTASLTYDSHESPTSKLELPRFTYCQSHLWVTNESSKSKPLEIHLRSVSLMTHKWVTYVIQLNFEIHLQPVSLMSHLRQNLARFIYGQSHSWLTWITYVKTWTPKIHLQPVSPMTHKWVTWVGTATQ